MIYNIVLGFIIPWTACYFILKNKLILVLLFAPFASMVAFTFNDLGVSLGFWDLNPIFEENESISALPLNLGIFPVMACLMVYYILKLKTRQIPVLLAAAAILTAMEALTVTVGHANYFNGWNIAYTFCSYLAALLLVYFYYRMIAGRFSLSV